MGKKGPRSNLYLSRLPSTYTRILVSCFLPRFLVPSHRFLEGTSSHLRPFTKTNSYFKNLSEEASLGRHNMGFLKKIFIRTMAPILPFEDLKCAPLCSPCT